MLGCGEAQTEAVKNALLEELSQVERAPAALAENMAMPRREPLYKTETFDTTQAKLCMAVHAGPAHAAPGSWQPSGWPWPSTAAA